MSLLADATLYDPNNSYYLTKNPADAGDITCDTITVNGTGAGVTSTTIQTGDVVINNGRLVVSYDPLTPGQSATPSWRATINGVTNINGGNNGQARLILGPSPAFGNNDYCSWITSTDNFAVDYSSQLGFWTHGGGTNPGGPTQRMTIDPSGNVNILTGNLIVSGTVSSANIPALPMLPSQTNYALTPVQVPINISAGVQTTNIGAPITVPKTGMYILLGSFNYDGAAGDGITFGSADFLAIRFEPVGPGTPRGVNINLRNCLGDNDGTCSNTFEVLLDSTVTYQPKAIMYNISGTSTITGTPNYYGAYALTALC
jgi:hypothetical protein